MRWPLGGLLVAFNLGLSEIGPLVSEDRLQNWKELGEASKKERSLIIKASGFHETAWGARSVTKLQG